MNSFIKPLTLLFLFSFLQSENFKSQATNTRVKEIESLIERRQLTTKSLRSQFTQSVLPENQATPIVSKGTLQYQKPQTLRIDFSLPEGEGMILTPTETTVWKKGLLPKSTPHDPLQPSFRRIILDILEKSPSDWDSQFQKSMREEQDSLLVTLTPLAPSERAPERVEVRMRGQDLQITEISVTMKKILWAVKFHSIQVNPPLKIKLSK